MTVSADKERPSPIVEPARVFTPGRIVALLLIAVAVAGLAYLRFAPDADSVSVPADAKAGDLILEDCDYANEKGTYEVDCGSKLRKESDAVSTRDPVRDVRPSQASRRRYR